MPVPSSLADLSTTAASNSPAGSDAIGTSLDDYLRTTQALLKQSVSRGTDIASSSSITIPTNGNYCVVTGTTTINSIADSWNGRLVTLKFSGALTLTHSASLILPGGENIVTAAGDCLQLVNESTGVWRCISVERSRGSDSISVKDFGAVGDGVTDDTAAIQAALDSGATGYIELTNSVISAEILPKTGQILRGGKLTAASGSFIKAVHFDDVTNAGLENVEITGDFDFGIHITNSSNVTIRNNNIHDIGQTSPEKGFGIIVGDYADPAGFSTNIKLVGNTIKNIGGNGSSRGDGITLSYCSQVSVSENYIDTVNRMGVAVISAASNISIVNNHIVNAALCGVDCEYDSPLPVCHSILIDGNTITNYARSGFTGIGTQLFAVDVHSDAYSVIVSNNVITPGSRATQVFQCQNGAYDVEFSSNKVLNGGSLDFFLKTHAGGGSNEIIVANNICIFGNVKSFIDLYDSALITVTGNAFFGSSAAGSYFININDVTDLIVSNNISKFTENFARGGIGTCSSLVFNGNKSETTDRGYDLYSSTVGIDGLTITNNDIRTPVGASGIVVDISSGYVRNINLLGNIIPSSTTKIIAAAPVFNWSVYVVSDRSAIVSPVAGQYVFELSTNKQIQYLSGAWVAPS